MWDWCLQNYSEISGSTTLSTEWEWVASSITQIGGRAELYCSSNKAGRSAPCSSLNSSRPLCLRVYTGREKSFPFFQSLLCICKLPTNSFAVVMFQDVLLSLFSIPISKWLLFICKQSTELKSMEEGGNSLVGIKFFIKHMVFVSLQMKTGKRNELQFLFREMFSLILSCLCFVLKLPPCKKSFHKESNQMAHCKTFNGRKSCEMTQNHLFNNKTAIINIKLMSGVVIKHYCGENMSSLKNVLVKQSKNRKWIPYEPCLVCTFRA